MAENELTKVAVVTGGQGGLGTELAKSFRAAGFEVAAPGRDELDVTNEEQMTAFFADLPRVDVAVHNAGVFHGAFVTKMSNEDFSRILDVSLRGAFLMTRAALKPMMKQRSGHLLYIGSRSAQVGPVGHSAYAAAKAGMEGLAKSVAKEYGARGIRANVIRPGFLMTKFSKFAKPAVLEEQIGLHELGELNTPEDSARFIVEIAQAEHISGQNFTLDSRIHAWC